MYEEISRLPIFGEVSVFPEPDFPETNILLGRMAFLSSLSSTCLILYLFLMACDTNFLAFA